MVQFAVAYFIMLYVRPVSSKLPDRRSLAYFCVEAIANSHDSLAMYYNGYIIICIFLGAYIGAFIFHWEHLDGG